MPERLDEVARAKWEELGPVLFRVGVLTEADGDVLGVYCEQFARYVQLEAELDRTGFWIEGSQGQDVRNPLIGDCRQQANLLRQLEAELGITPSARTRVKALPKGASNKFEQVG